MIASTLFLLATLQGSDIGVELRAIVASEVSLESAFVRSGQEYEADAAGGAYTVSDGGRRSIDSATLEIDTWKVPAGRVEKFWRDQLGSVGYAGPNLSFSELPLGEDVRREQAVSRLSLNTFDGTYFVSTSVTLGRNSQDVAGDKIACEGITRRTLARFRGLEARPGNGHQVGTTTVSTLVGARGNVLVDLLLYCQARGFSINVFARRGTASFESPAGLVVIPLAARKIKGGSQWFESQDISVIQNGRWYVPLNALNRACQG